MTAELRDGLGFSQYDVAVAGGSPSVKRNPTLPRYGTDVLAKNRVAIIQLLMKHAPESWVFADRVSTATR